MTGAETGLLGAVAAIILAFGILSALLYLVPIPLWIAAWASGAYVGLLTLVGMRLRRVPPGTVVTARISSVKAGLDIAVNDLEAHFLAGGNVVGVVNAMISADKANIPMPFKRAAAIDLAGRDILAAVKMSVIPKVIETPRIAAVAKDGIQLHAFCRVTVRTEPRSPGRGRRRGDRHRARRRGDGEHHRIRGDAQGRPREPGSHFEARAHQGT